MNELGIFLPPHGGMPMQHEASPRIFSFKLPLKVAGTHLCSRVERGAVRVSQKHHNGLNRSDWVSMANRKAITMGGKQQTEDG